MTVTNELFYRSQSQSGLTASFTGTAPAQVGSANDELFQNTALKDTAVRAKDVFQSPDTDQNDKKITIMYYQTGADHHKKI